VGLNNKGRQSAAPHTSVKQNYMNSLAKVQIPIEKIYLAINSPQVLNAQAIIKRNAEALTINSATDYSALNTAVKNVNDAVKAIEAARKEVTTPLEHFKKELIKLEKDATAPLIEFIEDAKKRMVQYYERLEAEQEAAEAKLKAEAAASLKQAESVNDIMAAFTDKLFATTVENNQTKNIRTTLKARIVGEVDWIKVLSVQFAHNNLTPEDLIVGLPKAMKELGVDSIAGVELYEHKTQVIR
jgi:F0F1-type ATP synthase membrane subunit b/b'